jgi:nicotinamidase-related amidase
MKRALLLIDVQKEYLNGKLQVKYPEKSYENILKAMDIATQHEIPLY